MVINYLLNGMILQVPSLKSTAKAPESHDGWKMKQFPCGFRVSFFGGLWLFVLRGTNFQLKNSPSKRSLKKLQPNQSLGAVIKTYIYSFVEFQVECTTQYRDYFISSEIRPPCLYHQRVFHALCHDFGHVFGRVIPALLQFAHFPYLEDHPFWPVVNNHS